MPDPLTASEVVDKIIKGEHPIEGATYWTPFGSYTVKADRRPQTPQKKPPE